MRFLNNLHHVLNINRLESLLKTKPQNNTNSSTSRIKTRFTGLFAASRLCQKNYRYHCILYASYYFYFTIQHLLFLKSLIKSGNIWGRIECKNYVPLCYALGMVENLLYTIILSHNILSKIKIDRYCYFLT
jgi:hypothetical protein